MQNLVTRSQLATMGKVSRQYITKACRPGQPFHDAIVGRHLDAGHPVIREWLEKRDGETTPPPKTAKKPAKKTTKKKALKKGRNSIPTPSEVEGLADDGTSRAPDDWAGLTLRELVDRFGGEPQALNWVKALSAIEVIRERRLKNEESEGSLIRRDLVETHILGLIEEQHQRLLTDLPKTVARTVRAHAQADPPMPLEASEREVRATMGKLLKATKSKVVRRLNK